MHGVALLEPWAPRKSLNFSVDLSMATVCIDVYQCQSSPIGLVPRPVFTCMIIACSSLLVPGRHLDPQVRKEMNSRSNIFSCENFQSMSISPGSC